MTGIADKTIIITGGNSGVGYECARTVAADCSYHIVLACRNQATARTAAERIRASTQNREIDVFPLDLASLSDVRRFAADIAAADLPPLRSLVCNAGIQMSNATTITEDGFEMTFAVNHLGHFLLANLLVDRMVAPGRIVFVSSGTHNEEIVTLMPHPRYRDFRALAQGDDGYPVESPGKAGRRRYSTSKLLNVFCTYEMARRLAERGIDVCAFDPGLVPGTGLARDYPKVLRGIWNYFLPLLRPFHPMISSARRSGLGLARLATDPALKDIHAAYYFIDKKSRSSSASHDTEEAARLWEVSANLADLHRSPAG